MPSTPGTVNYPGTLDDVISLLEAANGASAALTAPLGAADVVANIASAATFPATGAVVFNGVEIAYYTGKTGTTLTGLIRGQDGTAAANHASGALAQGRMIARHHMVLSEAIRATQAELDIVSEALATGLAGKSDIGHTHAFADITAKPNSIAGYGIIDAYTMAATDALLANKSDVGHTHSFASLTAKPTTLGGYGIMDAYTDTEVDTALAGKAALLHVHALADITGLIVGGKIASSLMPANAITDTFPVASQAAMLALAAQRGDVAVRSDLHKSFILADDDPTVLANWVELQTPTDAVTSVNSMVGVVVLAAADVGAYSTAQVDTFLAGKSDTGHTHTFASLTAKPTTIGGYGITDAYTKTEVDTALAGKANTVHTHAAADITSGILASARGGTGNGFTAFSGPAAATRTFTLPNANAVVLTDNAAVTIAQGGTGQVTQGAAINALLPAQAGHAGHYLTTDGTSPSWGVVSATDATKLPLDGSGVMTGTITSTIGTIAASTPALSATQEWNAAGVTFTGIFLNVTTTAQASASRLIDLQANGGSKFSVDKDGVTRIVSGMQISGSRVEISKDNALAWTLGIGSFGSVDTGIGRNAAGRVEINNGVNFNYRDLKLRDIYINGATYLARTTAALTNAAGAANGTLTNAPAAGNPTKWIQIDDNGTTLRIPAW